MLCSVDIMPVDDVFDEFVRHLLRWSSLTIIFVVILTNTERLEFLVKQVVVIFGTERLEFLIELSKRTNR